MRKISTEMKDGSQRGRKFGKRGREGRTENKKKRKMIEKSEQA